MHVMFAIIFHRRVWYRALSLCYACIRSSGIILIPYATFVPNLVSFAASIAESPHGEKSRTHLVTHPAYLMPREPKLALRNIFVRYFHIIILFNNHCWSQSSRPSSIQYVSEEDQLEEKEPDGLKMQNGLS